MTAKPLGEMPRGPKLVREGIPERAVQEESRGGTGGFGRLSLTSLCTQAQNGGEKGS